MDAPCYCTNHGSKTQFLDQASSSTMELDSALHELGMLSSVTESRIDYLKTRISARRERRTERNSGSHASPPVCIVHSFLTKFSLSKNSCSSDGDSQEELSSSMLKMLEISQEKDEGSAEPQQSKMPIKNRTHRRRLLNQMHMFKPYDFPWRSKLEDSLRNIPASTAAVTERASSPVMSRQDSSGNKSNPSSPVKSQNSLTPLGSSIVRSRSLDDLEIAKIEDCKEDSYVGCYSGRSDIDNVSQRISKLHVS